MTEFYLLVNENPNGPNFHPTRRKPIQFVVAHTAENLPYFKDDVDKGAENVASYGSNTTRDVSWHVTVDSDSIVWMLPDDHTAWHVRGYNSPSLGIEIATQAHRWDDAPEEWLAGVVENIAKVLAIWSQRHDIPLRRITREQADDGQKGIVAHADLDPSRRSDPGDDFPWQRVLDRAREIVLEGDDGGDEPEGQPIPEDQPEPQPQPQPRPEPRPTPSGHSDLARALPLIKRGNMTYHAGIVQALIHATGVEVERSFEDNHVPDRNFGPNTEDAVREYQVEHELMVDGVVGPETWTHLLAELEGHLVSREDNTRLQAKLVQMLLAAAGRPPAQSFTDDPYPHSPDGIFRYHTDRTVKKYQKRMGIVVDGIVGPVTLSRLTRA